MRIFIVFLIAAIVASCPVVSVAASAIRVIDGDTIDVNGVRFRLYGIDAPESGQSCKNASGKNWKCDQAAILAIEALVNGKSVVCDNRGKDDYDRILSVCKADGKDINAAMIDAGLAWSFRKYSHAYDRNEDAAHAKHIGIWQADNQPAWDYRHNRWSAAMQTAPDKKCPIKGNINAKHEKIYHTPWSRDYARTKINLAHGERWFCSEREALDAGWRAPKWGSK